MGIRMGWTWPHAFETFRRSPHVRDESLWRMVCLFREHGIGLLETPTGANFKSMEANGLAHVGFMFPELHLSRAFASTGLDRTVAEIDRQFLPDGSQIELAPAYSCVSISNSLSALKVAEFHFRRHGTPRGWEITPRVWDQFGQTVAALARMAAPDGTTPNTHDSEHVQVEGIYRSFGKHVDPSRFAGKPWQADADDLLPYAGYAILRREGRYALLDAGPYGAGHQHCDGLQVLAWADGDWLCVDPGKPLYDRSPMTQHIRSAAGHNVVLMDSQPRWPDPILLRPTEPMPVTVRPHHVAATRRFGNRPENPTAGFEQTRHLVDLAGVGWLVVDRLVPDDEAPHAWELLWHLNGTDLAVEGDAAALARDGRPDVRLRVVSDRPLTLHNATGQETPEIRGWWAAEAAEPRPLPTLQALARPAPGAVWLATLIAPGIAPGLSLEVATPEQAAIHIGNNTLTFPAPTVARVPRAS